MAKNGTCSIEWRYFQTSIKETLRECRNDEMFCDVILACDDDNVKAHRIVLSASSPLFRSYLRKREAQETRIKLKGVKLFQLNLILGFIYEGKVTIDRQQVGVFFETARLLKIKGFDVNNIKSYDDLVSAYQRGTVNSQHNGNDTSKDNGDDTSGHSEDDNSKDNDDYTSEHSVDCTTESNENDVSQNKSTNNIQDIGGTFTPHKDTSHHRDGNTSKNKDEVLHHKEGGKSQNNRNNTLQNKGGDISQDCRDDAPFDNIYNIDNNASQHGDNNASQHGDALLNNRDERNNEDALQNSPDNISLATLYNIDNNASQHGDAFQNNRDETSYQSVMDTSKNNADALQNSLDNISLATLYNIDSHASQHCDSDTSKNNRDKTSKQNTGDISENNADGSQYCTKDRSDVSFDTLYNIDNNSFSQNDNNGFVIDLHHNSKSHEGSKHPSAPESIICDDEHSSLSLLYNVDGNSSNQSDGNGFVINSHHPPSESENDLFRSLREEDDIFASSFLGEECLRACSTPSRRFSSEPASPQVHSRVSMSLEGTFGSTSPIQLPNNDIQMDQSNVIEDIFEKENSIAMEESTAMEKESTVEFEPTITIDDSSIVYKKPNRNLFACEECSFTSARKLKEKKHVKLVHNGDIGTRRSKSVSSKAGLHFPVGRVQRLLRSRRFARRVGATAPVYLTAVLQFLATEVLGAAGRQAKRGARKTIVPRHIQLAVRRSGELGQLLDGVNIAHGGVPPNLVKQLFPGQ